jgi:hypothetical protein
MSDFNDRYDRYHDAKPIEIDHSSTVIKIDVENQMARC